MSHALQLVQGGKEVRDRYVSKVDVLDKVKELSMLPDGEYCIVNQITDFYEVSRSTIESLLKRHKAEIEKDGLVSLKGRELKEYKTKILDIHNERLNARSNLNLYTKKAVLRIGMLLTCSEVAEKVRDYLVGVERVATDKQKGEVLHNEFDVVKTMSNSNIDEIKQLIKSTTERQNELYEARIKSLENQFNNLKKKYYNVKLENKELHTDIKKMIQVVKSAKEKLNRTSSIGQQFKIVDGILTKI